MYFFDKESYLFKAAVSELRTEIQVMRQKDTQQLKTETLMITREVETLAQRLREDVDSMKNEIALDMDNCKNETRSDHKEIDMTIQELNSKFTVQMGEVRTGLESARWETIWKGLGNCTLVKPKENILLTTHFSWCSRIKHHNSHSGLFLDKFCREKSRRPTYCQTKKEEANARRCSFCRIS